MNQGNLRMPALPPPTDGEVQMFRAKHGHQIGNMDDNQVKAIIMRQKQQVFSRNALQMQQNLRNAQMQSAQALASGGQQGGDAMQRGPQQLQQPPQQQQQGQGHRGPLGRPPGADQ